MIKLLACYLALQLAALAPVLGQPCTDNPPPGANTSCKQQKDWGKCDRSWMAGYCLLSCGPCTPGPAPTAAKPTTAPAPAAAPKPAPAAVAPPLGPLPAPPAPAQDPPPAQPPAAVVPSPEPLPAAAAAPPLPTLVMEPPRPPAAEAPAPPPPSPGPAPEAEQRLADLASAAAALAPGVAPEAEGPFADAPTPEPGVVVLPPTAGLSPPSPPPPTELQAAAAALAPVPPPPPAPSARRSLPCGADGEGPSALDAIRGDRNLANLWRAINITGSEGVFDSGANLTIFAPSNSAFARAAGLLSSPEVLQEAVLNQVVEGEALAGGDLLALGEVITAAGQPLFLSGDDNLATPALTLAATGSTARVVAPDYITGCGFVVHGIDAVLLPVPGPSGTDPGYAARLQGAN